MAGSAEGPIAGRLARGAPAAAAAAVGDDAAPAAHRGAPSVARALRAREEGAR